MDHVIRPRRGHAKENCASTKGEVSDMLVDIEFELRQCRTCGIYFQLPKGYIDGCQKDPNQWFYCPAGHKWHFSESNEDKIRRERDQLKQSLAFKDDLIANRDKRIKRLEKRAAAGSCPCCQRTFSNMSRHMKTKHPEFVADNVVKLAAKR